jgi:hypothetical protein
LKYVPGGLADEQTATGQEQAHDALHEQGNSPSPVVLDVAAEVVDPHTSSIASNVAGELDAAHASTVVGRRDLRLVDGNNGRQGSHTETGDDSAQHHHGHAVCTRLQSSTDDEDQGAVQDCLASAEDVANAADTQGRYESADLEDGNHGAQLGGGRLVEVGLEVHAATVCQSKPGVGGIGAAHVIIPDMTPWS